MLQNQDIDDTNWIKRPQVLINFEEVSKRNLTFDTLVKSRHLPVLTDVASQLPQLKIAIYHCAKPLILNGADAGDKWRDDMIKLADLPNVMCKISGLVNEAMPQWNEEALRSVVEYVLKIFIPERVVWGSDRPVLNLVGN